MDNDSKNKPFQNQIRMGIDSGKYALRPSIISNIIYWVLDGNIEVATYCKQCKKVFSKS